MRNPPGFFYCLPSSQNHVKPSAAKGSRLNNQRCPVVMGCWAKTNPHLGKLIGYKQWKVIEQSDIRRESNAISTEPAGHVP